MAMYDAESGWDPEEPLPEEVVRLEAENRRLRELVEKAYREGYHCVAVEPFRWVDHDWLKSRARAELQGDEDAG